MQRSGRAVYREALAERKRSPSLEAEPARFQGLGVAIVIDVNKVR